MSRLPAVYRDKFRQPACYGKSYVEKNRIHAVAGNARLQSDTVMVVFRLQATVTTRTSTTRATTVTIGPGRLFFLPIPNFTRAIASGFIQGIQGCQTTQTEKTVCT